MFKVFNAVYYIVFNFENKIFENNAVDHILALSADSHIDLANGRLCAHRYN